VFREVASGAKIVRSQLRRARRRFLNLFDSVNQLEQERAARRSGRLAEMLPHCDVIVIDELDYLPFSQSGGAVPSDQEALREHVTAHHHQLGARRLAAGPLIACLRPMIERPHLRGERKLLKVAALTMAYNEGRHLPVWRKYYGQQVGDENLWVIDHGSTDGSCDGIAHRLVLPRGRPLDEIDRAEVVSNIQRQLLGDLGRYDVVVFGDCDEFVVPRPSRYRNLADYFERSPPVGTVRCVGISVVQHDFLLPRLDYSQPILQQRPYGFVSRYSAKSLVSSVPMAWGPGFHTCLQPSRLDGNLWMFHLKFADVSSAIERLHVTRGIEWSERARKLGHGASHRVPDEAIIRAFATRQATCSNDSLDDLDVVGMVERGDESDLRRIGTEFLPAL
jgi:hypothetical protein